MAAALSMFGSLLGACEQSQRVDGSQEDRYVLAHEAARIDGKIETLEKYRGEVVLIVNVASKCGYTSQYAGLEKVYQAKKDAGFIVLGFPSNDFMGQEPGTNEEIAAFCSENFGVTFPMFAKVEVKGEGAHPLFVQLASLAGVPTWNFNKYLIDRQGNVVARFGSSVGPGSDELTAEIERLLSSPRG